jgi:hypothetical protein
VDYGLFNCFVLLFGTRQMLLWSYLEVDSISSSAKKVGQNDNKQRVHATERHNFDNAV